MTKVSVAALKAELSHYLEIAKKGGQVVVTSHGKDIANIIPIRSTVAPIVDWLKFFEKHPPVKLTQARQSAAEIVREIRDEE